MPRWLLLAALVLLALLAALLWQRESANTDRLADFARTATEIPDADPVELASPSATATSASRTEIPDAEPIATSTAAVSTWTGVRVRITSLEDGGPLIGMRVRSRAPNGTESWKEVDTNHGTIEQEPRTNVDGFAELELVPGTKYTIAARPRVESIGPASIEVDPPLAANEVRELALVLPTKPDLVFHGRVVDRETNAPIPSARVGRSAGWGKIVPEDEQRTDAEGRFHVGGTSWGRKVLNVLAPGYEIAAVRVITAHTSAESALEIALSPVASVRVTVLDAAGAPIAGVDATLATAMYRFGRPDGNGLLDAGWIDDATFRARTDASGVTVISDLPPRMPLEGVLWRGREELMKAPEVLTLAPGEARAVTWRIGSGCTITGVALEADGRPAAALSICLEAARVPRPWYFEPISSEPRQFTQTDAEGRFSFADAAPGDWWVGPAPKEYARSKTVEPDEPAPRAVHVVVPPATARVEVAIRVHRGLSIAGRVLDPTGAPAPHASITCTRVDEQLTERENVNDAAGNFLVGPIEPGEYELSAEAHARYVASEPLRVRAGDTGVVLRFRAGGSIRCLVVDKATGAPLAASCFVWARTPTTFSVTLPTADAHGKFTLDGLAPGVYDVAAGTSGGLFGLVTAVEVEAGAPRDVRVEVVPGAHVRVRYEGSWPHCGLTVLVADVAASTDGIVKGTEAVFASPAGAVVVRVRSYVEQKDFDLPLTLKVGETRDLVFDRAWK